MLTKSFSEVVASPFSDRAILRDGFPGFREDYLVLHSLIRRYTPQTFIEIGTSTGMGTKIICNAMEGRPVFSIDVPPGTDPRIKYPGPYPEDGHPKIAGAECSLPYKQLFGFSEQFNYVPFYPLYGWFVDGKHDYSHCCADTKNALMAKPRLIVWHDMQIQGVEKAVVETMATATDYRLYRVPETRMAYAVCDNA